MATVFAIDPGSHQSGCVLYTDGRVARCGVTPNRNVIEMLQDDWWDGFPKVAIEWVDHYGMAVGRDVFETVRWIGRFQQAWVCPHEVMLIPRREVKLELCGSARAKDGNVRQALLDRLGPKGTKKNPGPTYGVSGHVWSALAVAVVAEERLKAKAKEAA